jgi:hypothetical protein
MANLKIVFTYSDNFTSGFKAFQNAASTLLSRGQIKQFSKLYRVIKTQINCKFISTEGAQQWT